MDVLTHLVFLVFVTLLQAGIPIDEFADPQLTVSTHNHDGMQDYCMQSSDLKDQFLIELSMHTVAKRYVGVSYKEIDKFACLVGATGALTTQLNTWQHFTAPEQVMISSMIEGAKAGTWEIAWETGFSLTLPLPMPPSPLPTSE